MSRATSVNDTPDLPGARENTEKIYLHSSRSLPLSLSLSFSFFVSHTLEHRYARTRHRAVFFDVATTFSLGKRGTRCTGAVARIGLSRSLPSARRFNPSARISPLHLYRALRERGREKHRIIYSHLGFLTYVFLQENQATASVEGATFKFRAR